MLTDKVEVSVLLSDVLPAAKQTVPGSCPELYSPVPGQLGALCPRYACQSPCCESVKHRETLKFIMNNK